MKEKNIEKKICNIESKLNELNNKIEELEIEENYSSNVFFKEPVKNKYNR